MSKSEFRNCPKCGGEMMRGILSTEEKLRLETDLSRRFVHLYVGGWTLQKGISYADRINPFCCRKCGYIELYKKMKEENK